MSALIFIPLMIICVCVITKGQWSFIQRFNREINLISVSINPSSLPPIAPLHLALLQGFAIPPPVLTVAMSNLATLRELASIPHSSHAAFPFAFIST